MLKFVKFEVGGNCSSYICAEKVRNTYLSFRLSEFFSEFEMFLGNETEVGTVVQILEDLQTLQQIQQQALNGTLDCMFY